MTFYGEKQPILTPALEGSKTIVPLNARIPPEMYRSYTYNDPMAYNPMGYYGSPIPPIGGGRYLNYMPIERMTMPALMRPRPKYIGPPSMLPWWGEYSMQGQYYPGIIPIPIYVRRQIRRPVWIHQDTPIVVPKLQAKKLNVSNRPSSMFLFGIILKEIVAALHRIYLNPNGNIYPVLNDVIGPNCYDLASLVHVDQLDEREEAVLIQELQYVVENIIYHITEIMPTSGVLGTHRKSAVFELIRGGKRFPDGYFWQVELDRLQFTEHGHTVNVGDTESFLLLLGIFISRSLVTTILMKPIDYGLSSQLLSDVAERNLRIVASTILYLVRRLSISRGRGIMEMPLEISKYLYSDEEMDRAYSKLSRTFNYCEGLLREWGTEYIRRLRSSSMND